MVVLRVGRAESSVTDIAASHSARPPLARAGRALNVAP